MEKLVVEKTNVRIKWGLGFIPRLNRNTVLYHVVVNGHTLSSHVTEKDAKAWAYDWLTKHPTSRHDN